MGHSKRADLHCSHCQRTFAKPEHLQRHQRVHSGIKPFACSSEHCDKRFSRSDSLARHIRIHDRPSAHGVIPVTPNSDSSLTVTGPLSHGTADHNNVASDIDTYGLGTPSTPAALDANPVAHQFEGDGQYHWPDSEDIFALLASEPVNWALDAQIALPYPQAEDTSTPKHDGQTSSTSDTAQARQAIRHVDNMIQDLSFNLTSELAALGATSHFLDTCLSCFWSHFVPTFPVLHAPTFVLRDQSPPTLLNMIALGSLFMAETGAQAKGEVLWRLAHHALSTSWQSMLGTGSELQATNGMRLVLTALLGQCYAIMSGNKSIRLVGHVFHGLGFFWAYQTGLDHQTRPRAIVATDSEGITAEWHQWASHEVRNRALIGHYVLDGLITQSSGVPSSTRHTLNNLTIPCDDAAYDADNTVAWLDAMRREPKQPLGTFRELLLDLFADDELFCTAALSHMALPVLLEALQSQVSESSYAQGPAVGLPSRKKIGQALWRLCSIQIAHTERPRADVDDLMIRWHVVCISFCVQPAMLLRTLCHRYGIQQDLLIRPLEPSGRGIDLSTWCSTPLARRALLHAVAVVNLVRQLSLGNAHALHLPLALNTAATIMICFTLSGKVSLRLPDAPCWATVCSICEDSGPDRAPDNGVERFVMTGEASSSALCNLPHHINTTQSLLQSHFSQWAIAKEMSEVLRRLVAQRT